MTPGDEIARLWPLLPHPEGSCVRWFARKGSKTVGEFALNLHELQYAAELHRDYNFYVQPNPTNERCGARVAAKDITHWSWLFIDVDPVREKNSPLAALELYLSNLGTWVKHSFSILGVRPLVIDSGRGVQAWIRLDDQVLFADLPRNRDSGLFRNDNGRVTRQVARLVMSYWLKRLDSEVGEQFGCRIDTSVSDLPRVMRCPGTVNLKTGRPTSIIEPGGGPTPGLAYDVCLLPPSAITTMFAVIDAPPLPEGTAWQFVYPLLTLTAKKYIDEGRVEPGRHKAAYATARALLDHGTARSEVIKALREGNDLSHPPMSEQDLQRVVDSAIKG